ncbi:HNH endonuclease [Bradyrhizobium erythrophlei]|uniref:HNH endonuclease n=1 Tax=Bradyrhizobium erythrophlei TaxID=1437360 RepID=A0A1M7TS12_9BRAD|nr:HNH endonuclease signature motif containing protein [Bradyrhizobium erythrophlei]SHN73505.1 HNH endonuclease [Bradyrhizobium erythrophlei]
MGIPPNLAAEVLAKCGRHCCICRRFRPTQLQVHHIDERKDGGGDDFDNLIAICISCHSDVHTNTKLTRRFSDEELKRHRDNVYRLVADGKLPSGIAGSDDLVAITAAVIETLRSKSGQEVADDKDFPLEALDILLCATAEKKPVKILRENSAVSVHAGNGHFLFGSGEVITNGRPTSVQKLVSLGLVEGSADVLEVTSKGYAFADDVMSANPRYTMLKAKCLHCSLHFIVCTDFPERHSHATLICPECGQQQGAFLIWHQQMFGFIFQSVPGRQQAVAGAGIDLKATQSFRVKE